MLLFVLVRCLEVGLLGHRVEKCLTFCNSVKPISEAVVPFCITLTIYVYFNCVASLSIHCLVSLLKFNLPCGYIVVSYLGLICIFLMTRDGELLLCIYGSFHLFFCKLLKSLAHLLICFSYHLCTSLMYSQYKPFCTYICFANFFQKLVFWFGLGPERKNNLRMLFVFFKKTLSANSFKNKLFVPTRMSTVNQVHLNVPWGFRKSRSKKKLIIFPYQI